MTKKFYFTALIGSMFGGFRQQMTKTPPIGPFDTKEQADIAGKNVAICAYRAGLTAEKWWVVSEMTPDEAAQLIQKNGGVVA